MAFLWGAAATAAKGAALLKTADGLRRQWNSLTPEDKEALSDQWAEVRERADVVRYSLTRPAQQAGREKRQEQLDLMVPRLALAKQQVAATGPEFALTRDIVRVVRDSDSPLPTHELARLVGREPQAPDFGDALQKAANRKIVTRTGARRRWRRASPSDFVIASDAKTARFEEAVWRIKKYLSEAGAGTVEDLAAEARSPPDKKEFWAILLTVLEARRFEWIAPNLFGLPPESLLRFELEIPELAELPESRGLTKSLSDLRESIASMQLALAGEQEHDVLELTPGADENEVAVRTCPGCGESARTDGRFCTHCGTEYASVRTCPECSEEAVSDGKFCPYCGSTYDATSA